MIPLCYLFSLRLIKALFSVQIETTEKNYYEGAELRALHSQDWTADTWVVMLGEGDHLYVEEIKLKIYFSNQN